MIDANTLKVGDVFEIKTTNGLIRTAVLKDGIRTTELNEPIKSSKYSSWGNDQREWTLTLDQCTPTKLLAQDWKKCPQCKMWACGLPTPSPEQQPS
jgi:hypothetical protein